MRLLLVALWGAAACTPSPPTSGAPSPALPDGGAEVDASKRAPAAEAPAAPADSGPWPDAPGDSPSDVAAETEEACMRAVDGKAGQWGQIKFHTRTWRDLASRLDRGKGGGAELAARKRARCEERRDSACCKQWQ